MSKDHIKVPISPFWLPEKDIVNFRMAMQMNEITLGSSCDILEKSLEETLFTYHDYRSRSLSAPSWISENDNSNYESGSHGNIDNYVDNINSNQENSCLEKDTKNTQQDTKNVNINILVFGLKACIWLLIGYVISVSCLMLYIIYNQYYANININIYNLLIYFWGFSITCLCIYIMALLSNTIVEMITNEILYQTGYVLSAYENIEKKNN